MILTRSENIGVIACPGAESFTQAVIANLKASYVKRSHRAISSLTRRYELSREEVIKRSHLAKELSALGAPQVEEIHKNKPPRYRVPTRFTRFANGELKSEIENSVRGMDIFIIADVENHYPLEINRGSGQHHSLSVNDHLMMIFTTVDAVLGAGAHSCTLVLPCFPYARQHKKRGREALMASWFGKTCDFMGVSRIITLDLHSKAIENSLHNTRLENLHASYQVFRELLSLVNLEKDDLVVVSPDTGAVDRNKFYATSMELPLALLYKERDYSKVSTGGVDNNITAVNLLGDVKGKTVFMADDMLGTGGTLIAAMKTLKDLGAVRIICSVSLPLFSGNSIETFDEAYHDGLFHRIIGTDAVFHDDTLHTKEWFISTGISKLFAEVISRLHHGKSLSPLLDNREIIGKLLKRSGGALRSEDGEKAPS